MDKTVWALIELSNMEGFKIEKEGNALIISTKHMRYDATCVLIDDALPNALMWAYTELGKNNKDD